jgi:hypothetical protein
MRTKVKVSSPASALNRVLDGLEHEIVDASDEEILAVARELGMDPQSRESAAFAGVKFPSRPQLSDFFDLDGVRQIYEQAQRTVKNGTAPKPRGPRAKPAVRRDSKEPGNE